MKTRNLIIILVIIAGLSVTSQNHVYAPCANDEMSCGDVRPLPYNMSPLDLFKAHFSLERIECKQGTYLAIRLDHEPACLKAASISKFASRGLLYGAHKDSETTILIPPGSEDQASNKTYSPSNTTVVIGINSTVTWVNQAITGNSIVSDMPVVQDLNTFGSNVLRPGDSYRYTFSEPGTFHYHGAPHPWQRGTINVLSIPIPANLTGQYQNTTYGKPDNPLGVAALVIWGPYLSCMGPCPPYNFYLKINSNSTAYLLGYDICGNDLCVKNDTLSILLPKNNLQIPNYTEIGLSENKKWSYGDTVNMRLEISSTADNKTAYFLDIKNSTIVP